MSEQLRDAEARSGSQLELVGLIRLLLRSNADLHAKLGAVVALELAETEEAAREATMILCDTTIGNEVNAELARIVPDAPARLEAFQKDLVAHKVGNPSNDSRFYGTDRSPRRRMVNIDGVRVPISDEGIPQRERF